MEQFLRVGFWTVTLFSFLQAKPLTFKDSNIDYMRKHVTCIPGSVFYAPKDVKVKCITAALGCVKEELQETVAKECSDPNDDIEPAVEYLELVIHDLKNSSAPANASECNCQIWPQTPISEFLDKMENLIQLHNTVSSLQ